MMAARQASPAPSNRSGIADTADIPISGQPLDKRWLRAAEQGDLGRKDIHTRHPAFYKRAQYHFDAFLVKALAGIKP